MIYERSLVGAVYGVTECVYITECLCAEVASGMLGSQEQHMRQSQREILDDITEVRENIQLVWGRIGEETDDGR